MILLDDPFSNLDAETEKEILNDLETILQDKTAIIVSQRLSPVKIADRVIVMENGSIVEEGKPEELVRKGGGAFAKMLESAGDVHDE